MASISQKVAHLASLRMILPLNRQFRREDQEQATSRRHWCRNTENRDPE